MGLAPEQVLPFSTGVIVEILPVERIEAGLPAAIADLQPDHWLQAAKAIMTTDTVPKAASCQVQIGSRTVTGIAKGAGMVRPNMGGHTQIASLDCADGQLLQEVVIAVSRQLAQVIVRDGEGATKFITVQVDGEANEVECRRVAYAIAHSPLVTTAFFASDPNLGRILAAVA